MRLTGLICLLFLALTGCAPRGAITLDPQAAPPGSPETIYVAAARLASDDAQVFSRGRTEDLSFARFVVSVPPDRQPGSVTFPRHGSPDPATDFLTLQADRYRTDTAFLAAVNRALADRPPDNREITVFIHGFNTNFPEALYRQAQMRHDFGFAGVGVNFAWASAARLHGYAYDRESVMIARDALEDTLELLGRSNARRIIIMAHSMGAQLAMETLRQMAIRGQPRFFDRLAAVVLMAPDMDVDVFRASLRPLKGKDIPFYLFVSTRDRALRLSSLLRFQSERLGSIRSTTSVEGLPVTVIDLSDVESEVDPLRHFKVATSPAMIAVINGMDRIGLQMIDEADRRPGLLDATVNVVNGVTEVVLTPLGQ